MKHMTQTQPTLDLSNVTERENFFSALYERSFPYVATFVAHRGGSFQDAKDIFHDALVIFYEKIVGGKLPASISEERYILGIAKHLWLRKFKEDDKKVGLDETENTIAIPGDYFGTSENRLISFLEITGKKCLTLLQAFYYDNLPLQKIKEALGFSTVHAVSVQKYKCIEKMRNAIQKKSMGYEDFN
jgi:DNA-directed RNA polymerase specialized sigma24 family protein